MLSSAFFSALIVLSAAVGENESCGANDAILCDSGLYCSFPISANCGSNGDLGTCRRGPDVCTQEYAPVCGCDGTTYSNPCAAATVGVSIESEGACLGTLNALCGSRGAPDCADGLYCAFPLEAQCGAFDQPGVCKALPDVCTAEYAPVCGCDGKTHSNSCAAASSGVGVKSMGECPSTSEVVQTLVPTPRPGTPGAVGELCGGEDGGKCERGLYCAFANGNCGENNTAGTCRRRLQVCKQLLEPVCGCNGLTFPNECLAAAVAVSVRSKGSCKHGVAHEIKEKIHETVKEKIEQIANKFWNKLKGKARGEDVSDRAASVSDFAGRWKGNVQRRFKPKAESEAEGRPWHGEDEARGQTGSNLDEKEDHEGRKLYGSRGSQSEMERENEEKESSESSRITSEEKEDANNEIELLQQVEENIDDIANNDVKAIGIVNVGTEDEVEGNEKPANESSSIEEVSSSRDQLMDENENDNEAKDEDEKDEREHRWRKGHRGGRKHGGRGGPGHHGEHGHGHEGHGGRGGERGHKWHHHNGRGHHGPHGRPHHRWHHHHNRSNSSTTTPPSSAFEERFDAFSDSSTSSGLPYLMALGGLFVAPLVALAVAAALAKRREREAAAAAVAAEQPVKTVPHIFLHPVEV